MFRTVFAFCFVTAGMTGLWALSKFLVTGISLQFGAGVFVGTFLTLGLQVLHEYVVERPKKGPRY